MFGAHHLYAFCVVQSLNDNWCPVFTEILPIAKITFFFSVLTRVFLMETVSVAEIHSR